MSPNWSDTQELITATFEQPADARERYVREHCVDPVLREAMAALVQTGGGSPAPAPDDQPELPAGSRVGPYIIVHRLGRGGMGEVFLGRDPRLERSVALKCLFSSRAGGETLQARVIREARAAARISHAHVAAVHDVIEHDGRAFIVMEYVEGESLAVLLARETPAPDRVVAIGRQIASALAAAHASGVIHRDLKPANIQVTPGGSIKILDFGIATALATVATTTTSAGLTVGADTRAAHPGTPAYMSPEHLLGRVVDERSDLFSLGVILFEMATGHRPFPSNHPLDVLMATVRKRPRADDLNLQVPAPLAEIIEKALAADPNERFQSAAELGAALESLSRELPASRQTDARTPGPVPRTRVRLSRIALTALAVPFFLWILGRLSSAAFNQTLGREGFAAEPFQVHLIMGARSLVGPVVYGALALTAIWTARFVFRLLSLMSPLARTMDTVTSRWTGIQARLSLNDPIVLAQALATLGGAAIAAVVFGFATLIGAWANFVNTAPASVLWRLSPSNEGEKVAYRFVLTVLFLAFASGLSHVLTLRSRLGTRGGRGPLVALGLVVMCLLLLNELPFRILWRPFAVRGEYGGARCYIIGEDAARALLYCPDNVPPRNKVVQKNDPRLHSTGVVENIFSVR